MLRRPFAVLSDGELHHTECRVDAQQRNALRAAQLALEEGGQGEQQHHGEHDRELQHQRCIVAEEQGVLRDGKGCLVITMRAATIARNWGQFMEFMLVCSKKNVDVVCIDKVEDAQAIFQRIQEFKKRFFEGSDVTCE